MNHSLLNKLKRIGSFKTLIAIATVVTVSACSSSGGGSDGGGGGESLGTGPLAGVWEQCKSGFKTTYTFTDARWTENKALYQSQDCSGPVFPDSGFDQLVFEGVYSLEGASTSEGGLDVQLFNMTSDKLNGTAVFESARVSQFNIVYTGTAGQLVFGDFNQRSEANRPTQLLFDEPFVRR